MPKKAKQDVWGALADNTRREILLLLRSRPHTAGELADQFELTAATVSHHLAVLRASGLVHVERRAQTLIYSLAAEGFGEVSAYLKLFARGRRK